uniref:F-box protein At3g26010-like beta-propeller domain-containing protein n=1 Tax=Aegilops tauschii subsp. strangulata TaxID=200361 RepID=A0A452XW07_AEGTS
MKLSQTLAGFFTKHDSETVLCCNGLLLCSCCATGKLDMIDYHQFVCNPTTKEWVALPDHNQAEKWRCSRLGFNPTVAPHFYVFEFFKDFGPLAPSVVGVEVYSSETGERVREEHELDNDFSLPDRLPSVFSNGCLHYLTNKAFVAVVDTEGKACRNIPSLSLVSRSLVSFSCPKDVCIMPILR